MAKSSSSGNGDGAAPQSAPVAEDRAPERPAFNAKAASSRLPEWATLTEREGRIPVVDVDTHAAYPELLGELGVDQPDRYWVEVAYQCIKLDLQLAMRTPSFEIRMHDEGKQWALKDLPEGQGVEAADRAARGEYRRIRGFLPG
jgi:hypothetical protein